MDFGLSQKTLKKEDHPITESSEGVVPTDEDSMETKGEELGESGVGSSSQQPGLAKSSEKGVH